MGRSVRFRRFPSVIGCFVSFLFHFLLEIGFSVGLPDVASFPLSSPLFLINKYRKSWFPEGMVFLWVFVVEGKGSAIGPFLLRVSRVLWGVVWFGRVVLRGRFFQVCTMGRIQI